MVQRAGRGRNIHFTWNLGKTDATKVVALRDLWERNEDWIAELPTSARACLDLVYGLLASGARVGDVARF